MPKSQSMQLVAFDAAYVPGGQSVQGPADPGRTVALIRPGSHVWQTLSLALGCTKLQLVQVAVPDAAAYVPAAQTVHAPALCALYFPIGHSVHALAPAPEYLPAGQMLAACPASIEGLHLARSSEAAQVLAQ